MMSGNANPIPRLMALLLAGGKGSRLKTLTKDMPKPLVPYAGTCRMIDFSLRNCVKSGVQELLLMSKHEERQIHDYLLEEWKDSLKLHFGCYNDIHDQVPEEVYARVTRLEEKGTADALIRNQPFIDRDDIDDVLILHSDHIYNFDYRPMFEQHKRTGAALTLGFQQIPRRFVSLFGMTEFDADNNLTAFVEKPANPTSDYVFTAVCIFDKAVMYRYLDQMHKEHGLGLDISHHLIPAMLANGEVIKGFKFDDYWEDIGTTERYYLGHMRLLHETIGLNPPVTLPGAELITLANVGKLQNVIMSRALPANQFTAKNSVIYPGAIIEPNCYIKDSVIMPGATISSGQEVTGALVGIYETEYFSSSITDNQSQVVSSEEASV
ncbi:NTP transferase domain-containing protein [Paraneptunicella aestuarii]|uniref:sugar phosphate nucleotidyltransferase n=1 Tax=Paraneptunicella aestuarii TaxID=2831148 RepID=UPI001E42AA60|nr:sugar phosphate nucleotidyltransferase [Paraneptunicella aestuarii]UAA39737.1 NTP transferase domain-containing protein [Paraneptunicella aestuarii]